jgi:hypothetical protein
VNERLARGLRQASKKSNGKEQKAKKRKAKKKGKGKEKPLFRKVQFPLSFQNNNEASRGETNPLRK